MTDTHSPRRRALAGLGALAATSLLPACSPLPTTRVTTPRVGPLAGTQVSPDRVTRVLVGLRPYRPAGYVVEATRLGDKRLVHHYGHGGAGITLAWGTAHEAVGLGFAGAGASHAVLGCGVVGLATARMLQRQGAKVTLYAAELPPLTTSNIAGGHWWPYSAFDAEVADEAFKARFHRAVRLAYREFQGMVGPRYGVHWRRNYAVYDEQRPIGPFTESMRDVAPELEMLPPGTHPFGPRWVQQFSAMMIEPAVHLRALLDDFLLAGGQLVVRRFDSPRQVAALPEPVVFNCTGLGARALFGDEQLQPARGQLVVLLPEAGLDYNLFYRSAYIFPRTDGLVLGGTFQRGDWNLQPDDADTARILAGAKAAFAALVT
ncbi:MAG: FAD-dependent oxidoreductase [Pseudomonadota bacterium]